MNKFRSSINPKLRVECSEVEWISFNRLKDITYRFYWQKQFKGDTKLHVVDFFIDKPYNLIIEIDGPQHSQPEHQEADKKRDFFLSKKGMKILRIPAKHASKFDIESYLNEIYPLEIFKQSIKEQRAERRITNMLNNLSKNYKISKARLKSIGY